MISRVDDLLILHAEHTPRETPTLCVVEVRFHSLLLLCNSYLNISITAKIVAKNSGFMPTSICTGVMYNVHANRNNKLLTMM